MFPGFPVCFFVGVVLPLTLIDTLFPYTSIRLGLLNCVGLPGNEVVVRLLEPKQPEVGSWELTGLHLADNLVAA